MKKLLLVLFVTIFASGVSFAQDIVPKAGTSRTELELGTEALLRGELEKADELFRESAKKNPDKAPPGIYVVYMYNDKFNDRETRFWLEKTAEEYPEDPEAYLLLSQIAYAELRTAEARVMSQYGLDLTEKYTLNPERKKELEFRALGILASVDERTDNWKAALPRVERMLEFRPELPELVQRKGTLLFRLDRTTEAIETMDRANKLDEKILPGYAAAAKYYQQEKNTEEAKKNLEIALEKFPENARVFALAADLRLQWYDLEAAVLAAEKAKELSPRLRDAVLLCGITALYKEKYTEAERFFQELLFVDPNDPDAIEGMALALCEQDGTSKHDRAIMYAQINEKAFPNSADVLCSFAWVSYKIGKDKKQVADLLKHLAENNRLTLLGAYCYARIYAESENTEDAVYFLEHILNSRTNFPKRAEAKKLFDELTKKDELPQT